MSRKSLLLLLSISFFLIAAPLAKGDSTNNLTHLDSGQSFTLYGSDWTGISALTPDSFVHTFRGANLTFSSGVPEGGRQGLRHLHSPSVVKRLAETWVSSNASCRIILVSFSDCDPPFYNAKIASDSRRPKPVGSVLLFIQ
jgi:hypothetical protein